MSKIEIFVFDIGRVLVEWEPEEFYKRVIGADRAKAFFAAVPIFDIHFRSDAGENFYDVIAEAAENYPDWRDEIQIWADRWADFTNVGIDGTIAIKDELHRMGKTVYGLSNFGAENFPITQAMHPCLQNFDKLFLSGELKISKPDPRIYAHVETHSGHPPSTHFFIDDSPANIEAAADRGWQTHLFETPDKLRRDLSERGLIDA